MTYILREGDINSKVIDSWDKRRARTDAELTAIGNKIIASPEFQARRVNSEKDDNDFPFDPICIAIMNGYYK
jgi:hypothetical protein